MIRRMLTAHERPVSQGSACGAMSLAAGSVCCTAASAEEDNACEKRSGGARVAEAIGGAPTMRAPAVCGMVRTAVTVAKARFSRSVWNPCAPGGTHTAGEPADGHSQTLPVGCVPWMPTVRPLGYLEQSPTRKTGATLSMTGPVAKRAAVAAPPCRKVSWSATVAAGGEAIRTVAQQRQAVEVDEPARTKRGFVRSSGRGCA